MAQRAPVALVLLALAAGASCARPQARTPTAPVALAIPPPPPRVHVPVSLEAPEPPPAPAMPAPAPDAPVDATTTSRSVSVPPPPPAKPTAPVADTPPPVLQTYNASELEKTATKLIDSAQRNLDTVVVGDLSPNAREQYLQAARFVRQAQQALVVKNFPFAMQLAENANTLARLLVKRDEER